MTIKLVIKQRGSKIRMKMFIMCISLMCVLLSSCAIPSSNGNYFELDDYDKLTSFSALH